MATLDDLKGYPLGNYCDADPRVIAMDGGIAPMVPGTIITAERPSGL